MFMLKQMSLTCNVYRKPGDADGLVSSGYRWTKFRCTNSGFIHIFFLLLGCLPSSIMGNRFPFGTHWTDEQNKIDIWADHENGEITIHIVQEPLPCETSTDRTIAVPEPTFTELNGAITYIKNTRKLYLENNLTCTNYGSYSYYLHQFDTYLDLTGKIASMELTYSGPSTPTAIIQCTYSDSFTDRLDTIE